MVKSDEARHMVLRHLDEAPKKRGRVGVTVIVGAAKGQRKSRRSSGTFDDHVRSLLARLGGEAGGDSDKPIVHEHLRSFSVHASPALVEAMLDAPEIEAVMPSRPAQDVMIRPTDRVSVEPPQPPEPSKRRGNSGRRTESTG